MKRPLLLAAIVSTAVELLLSYPRGTTGILEGLLRDKQTREPLVGVNIIVVGTPQGTVTDIEGRYQINNIPAGAYDVRMTLIGFRPLLVHKVTIVQDQRTRLDQFLDQSPVEMGAMEVVAERPLIRKDQAATVFSIGDAKIDRLPVSKFQDVVLLQPGTTFDGNVRGGKKTEVVYLVDGMPVQDVVSGGLAANLPKSAISGMTIQTGGFEAEYGNAMSGIVNVVTKNATQRFEGSARFELDSWIHSGLNKAQDRRLEGEVSLSGPVIGDALRFYTSNLIQVSDTRWWQDMEVFFKSPVQKELGGISKVEYFITPLIKLSLNGVYTFQHWRDYEFVWRYNLAGLPPRSRNAMRLSLSLTHTLSDNAYYTVSVNRYDQRTRVGEGERNSALLAPYEYDFFLRYIVAGSRNWWADTRQIISTAKADVFVTMERMHLVKAGAEFNYYKIDSDIQKLEPQLTYYGKPIITAPMLNYSAAYNYQPRSGSLYLQDKVELAREGSNFSVGVRWDFLDPRASRPDIGYVKVGTNRYVDSLKGYVPASFKHQFSPRVSLAIPVGVSSYFFTNFGHYFQFPLFDYLYAGTSPSQIQTGVKNVQAGNPDLEPERTVSWEFGFKHGINANVVASLTYFKKRVTNQIDAKTLVAFDSKAGGGFGFASYVNNSEANVSGLEVVIDKEHSETFNGSISYTYMVTEGLSESVNQGVNIAQWGFPIPATVFPLSWDQRHTLKFDVEARLPFGIESDIVGFYSSPRPYTYYPTRDGYTPQDSSKVFVPNNRRMKEFFLLNMKLTRTFEFLNAGSKVMLYVDVRNLLNTKNVKWMDSNGRIGGELDDPTAYYDPRRVSIGLKIDF